jgi:hypothetical protein
MHVNMNQRNYLTVFCWFFVQARHFTQSSHELGHEQGHRIQSRRPTHDQLGSTALRFCSSRHSVAVQFVQFVVPLTRYQCSDFFEMFRSGGNGKDVASAFGSGRPGTSRPVSVQGRFVRLGTASLLSNDSSRFINVDTIDVKRYIKRPALAKVLCEYLLYHEHNPKKALELCSEATIAAEYVFLFGIFQCSNA